MKFKEGHKKVPGSGMKQGQKTEKVQAWETMGNLMLGKFTNEIIELWDDLEPEKKIDLYMRLLGYFKPQLQRSDNTTEHTFKGSGLKIGYGDKGAE